MNGYGAANYGINIYGQAAYVDAASSINAASTLTANSNATMSGVVIIGMVSGMTALGRLKYEPEPVNSADWDALPTSSTSWVDL